MAAVHITATVREPKDINAGLGSVSSFCLVQDSSQQGLEPTNSGQVFPTQLDSSRKHPPRLPLRCVATAILNPVKLPMKPPWSEMLVLMAASERRADNEQKETQRLVHAW